MIPRRHREMRAVERFLDLALLILVERHPIRIPQLDSVVRSRVVRGRDDRAARKLTGSPGQGWGRDETRVDRGCAGGKDPGRERLDEHWPGDAGIPPDNRAPVGFSEDHSDMEGELGDTSTFPSPRIPEEPNRGTNRDTARQ